MKKQTKPKKKPPTKPTHAVLVLDKTGSMGSCIEETITGYNAYVDGLRKAPKMIWTLVQFDSIKIETMQSGVPIKDAIKLSRDNYKPGAMTPLYDAVGKTIKELEEKAKDHDVLFITLTDGIENASTEWSFASINKLIKEMEAKDWTFAHIGVGAEGWAAGNVMYAGTQSAGNVLKTSGKNMVRSFARAAGQSVSYASASGLGKANLKANFFAGKKDDTDEN